MANDRGIIGDRLLLAIQTFDISRLTTHTVEIVPGTFIAVSGIGPKGDSNGSGKTSFLAAVSILLADPQWNLESNGGKPASGILFRPDAAGLDSSLRVTPAPHGYIAAVFAGPDTPEETALTVWVRISATYPYLQARWVHGLHVADAAEDEDRARQADSLWLALPPASTISAKRMPQELYGEAPKCLSYLDTDLRPSIPSLLSQQMTKMEPAEIGTALIGLSGLSSQLDEENQQRSSVLTLQNKLAKNKEDATRTRAEENAELAAIDARDRARQLLDDAHNKWMLYTASQYLAVLKQDRQAQSTLFERATIFEEKVAETAAIASDLMQLRATGDLAKIEDQARVDYNLADEILQDLKSRHTQSSTLKSQLIVERNSLTPRTSRWNGQSVEQAAAEISEATDAQRRAQSALETAQVEAQAAQDALTAARTGRSGRAGALVRRLHVEANIRQAAALADVIDLDDDARRKWEPILFPLRDAVVVLRAQAKNALAALADEPGTQIIVADFLDLAEPRISSGGIRYPAGLQPLVNALTERFTFREGPVRADDDALAASTLGNFPEPLVGREALVQRAEKDLDEAEVRHKAAEATMRGADARMKLARLQDDAAHAVARLTAIATEIAEHDRSIVDLEPKIGSADQNRTTAHEAYKAASSLRNTHSTRLQLAEFKLKGAQGRESEARKKLDQARADRSKLAVEAWRKEFGGSESDAAALYEVSADGPTTRPQTLLRHAAEHLRDAMAAYLDGSDKIPEDLANAAKDRDQFAEQQPDKVVPFGLAAEPLRIRLRGFSDRDRITRSRIETQRRQREQALEELRIEATNSSQRLITLQDMIEHTIEATLDQTGKALGRLTTHGACLDWTSVRPDGAAAWRWEVTPKWKRSPNSNLVSYKENANSAQVKVFAIHLVLAALIADTRTTGRVLILDELGNSLGDVNRRDVLASLSRVAEQQQVTILGTCQDSVLSDAADYFGELIWFTHTTTTDAYNQPTRVWGHDAHGERVELTADWLQAGRSHG